ncbi:MAG: MFS transporter [Clostridiales bacterium]|nr:MFS transporter [Clostridiales bacterium]
MKYQIDRFTALYIFPFAAIGVLFPLIGQYLSYIGFTGAQIGTITASATAIGIVSNSFWGSIFHSTNRNKKLILFLCIITACLALCLMLIKQFLIFLLMYIIIFFFENPIFPLIDATTIQANYPFGKARKWGAVGFALGIGVAGFMADSFGLITIFPIFSFFFNYDSSLYTNLHKKRFSKARLI